MKEQEIRDISQKIRKCQRNWQLDKSLPQEHIELFAEIAKHSPSKQDEAYFDVYVITQRSLIEKYYKESIGFTAFKEETKPEITNPVTSDDENGDEKDNEEDKDFYQQ